MRRNKSIWSALLLILPWIGTSQVTWLSGTELDLGELVKGKEVEAKFVLRNDGQQPLLIEHIRTSCGCTIPEWESTPIAPGSTYELLVKWEPGRRGHATQRLKVFYLGIRKPSLLSISGKVR